MIYHGLAAFALLVVLVGAVVASLVWTKPVGRVNQTTIPAGYTGQRVLWSEIAPKPFTWTDPSGTRRVWTGGSAMFEFDEACMVSSGTDQTFSVHYVHDYTPAVAELADENTTYCDAWGRS